MKPMEEIIRSLCPPMAPLPAGMEARLDPLPGVRAVLFDVYGTLFVSGSGDVGTAAATDSAEAMAQALGAVSNSGAVEQAGERGRQLLQAAVLEAHAAARAAGVDYPEVDIEAIWKQVIEQLGASRLAAIPGTGPETIRRLALEYECRVNPVWPMPGALETIQTLKERGLVLGIVSNAQFYTPLLFPAFFSQTIEELGFDPACCVWSYRERRGKPSAMLFPKAVGVLEAQYGIGPEETVYVGNDMLNDIHTAEQARCRTVLFAGDQRSLRLRENDERCSNLEPDAVITALSQLCSLIQGAC